MLTLIHKSQAGLQLGVYCGYTDKEPATLFALTIRSSWRHYVTLPASRGLHTSTTSPAPSYFTAGWLREPELTSGEVKS